MWIIASALERSPVYSPFLISYAMSPVLNGAGGKVVVVGALGSSENFGISLFGMSIVSCTHAGDFGGDDTDGKIVVVEALGTLR